MKKHQFPIGKLQVPEQVKEQHIHQWLEEIDSYASRLRKVVESLTDEQLKKKYREDSWNVRQLVHHITDSQINMYQRLKLALTNDHPTVPPFDQDEWAIQPDTHLPVEPSLQILEGINQRIVALGKQLANDDLKRAFTLDGHGEILVAEKIAKLSWHAEHHLAHIKIALKD